jgi:hypothetical protein
MANSSPCETHNGPRLKKRTRLLILAQIGFCMMLAMGAAMELVLALDLLAVPDEVKAILTQWHSSPIVKGWVLSSNALILFLAPGLATSGFVFLCTRKGVIASKRLALSLFAIILLGQAVMTGFVYPHMEAALLVPSLMGGVGALVFVGFLLRFWTIKSNE